MGGYYDILCLLSITTPFSYHILTNIRYSRGMKSKMQQVEMLSNLLDNQFKIGPWRFGLDPLIDLIPGVGDVLTTGLSFYIVYLGFQLGVPKEHIMRMIGNVVFDFLLDFIPILGQVADFAFKANVRNLEIIKKYAQSEIKEAQVVG